MLVKKRTRAYWIGELRIVRPISGCRFAKHREKRTRAYRDPHPGRTPQQTTSGTDFTFDDYSHHSRRAGLSALPASCKKKRTRAYSIAEFRIQRPISGCSVPRLTKTDGLRTPQPDASTCEVTRPPRTHEKSDTRVMTVLRATTKSSKASFTLRLQKKRTRA